MPVEEKTDLRKLQEEAAQRAREMQRRSQIPHEAPVRETETAQEIAEDIPLEAAHMQAEKPTAESPAANRVNMPPEEPAGMLDDLFHDSDRTLILLLLALLSGENSSDELTFALLFLLM